jgi:hypothetical protein
MKAYILILAGCSVLLTVLLSCTATRSGFKEVKHDSDIKRINRIGQFRKRVFESNKA